MKKLKRIQKLFVTTTKAEIVILFFILFFCGVNAENKTPEAVFITKLTLQTKISVIEDTQERKRIFDYINSQRKTQCMADYVVHIYHTKDSVSLKPIWLECCENEDALFKEFLFSKIQEDIYRIYEFSLPVANDPKHVFKTINNTNAFIYFNLCDTMRLHSMRFNYARKGRVNKRKEWHLFINRTRVDTLATKIESQISDFELFAATLFFNDLKKLAIAKDRIEDDHTFQIHTISVPVVNKYTIIFPRDKGKMIHKHLQENITVPYMIGSNKSIRDDNEKKIDGKK